MGNAVSNRNRNRNRSPCSSSSDVTNRSNRINCTRDDTHQSVAVDKKRAEAFHNHRCGLARKVRSFRRVFTKSRGDRAGNYLKFSSFIGENGKWLPSVAPQDDFSPCFNRRSRASYLLDTLNGAADECTSVCCDLLTVLTASASASASASATCNDNHEWKLSDSFSGLFCGPLKLNCIPSDESPLSQLPRSRSAATLLSLPVLRHSDSYKDVNGDADANKGGERASISAGTEVFNLNRNHADSVSASSAEQPHLGINDHELHPLAIQIQAPFEDCTAASCQQVGETMLLCAAEGDNFETLPVREFATWYKETVVIMQQQLSDNTQFSRFLFNNLQLFSKADLRKLKALNTDAQKQVRHSVALAAKLRATLCNSLNHAYAKYLGERERELSQLAVQQKAEQRLLVNGHKAICKKTQRRSASSTSWIPCACYGYTGCAPVGDGALETLIAAQFGEMKLEKERKLHELQCRFALEKRQLLVEQEERRLANLECAIRQLSQFEVAETRAFCQRRCELLTKRVKTEIELIRRVRLAKRDALCRRHKSELKRARKASKKRHDHATVLPLCDVNLARAPHAANYRTQHQADLRDFDQTTAKLAESFENMASQKLRDLMDLCELRFNQLHTVVQCKISTLRQQHAERLRLLHSQLQLDSQNSHQHTRFPAHQFCLPIPLDQSAPDTSRSAIMCGGQGQEAF